MSASSCILRCRNADEEARAEHRLLAVRARLAIAVLGPDAAAVRIDDLLRDRQAEARVGAEAAFRPVGVEALEDALQIVRADAGAAIVDAELDVGPDAPARAR